MAEHKPENELKKQFLTRFTASDGKEYDYDAREDLMDKESLQNIANIMGLNEEDLNNTRYLKLPPYAGAIRVTRRFREADPEPTGSFGLNSLAPNPEADRRWASIEKDDFSLRPAEVKERTAWTWKQTADLYDRNADTLEEAGIDNESLNLNTQENKQAVLSIVVQKLRMRAHRARQHAISLSSSASSNELPTWIKYGDTLSTEDVTYYCERYWIWEDIQRREISRVYTRAAQDFLLEGVHVYIDELLEEKGRTNTTANKYISELLAMDALQSMQSLWLLWASACRWSAELSQGGTDLSSSRRRTFRDMIRRAVDHYAHAEWLIEEVNEMNSKLNSSPQRKRIAAWRLAIPSSVYLYHNDCMITTFVTGCNGVGPFFWWTAPEDEWRDVYVGAILSHSDYRWDIDTGYGAPGAPDTIYHRLATRSFPETPMTMNMMEPAAPLLASLVAPSDSKLERCIAIIADSIFEKHFAFMTCTVKLLRGGAQIDKILMLLANDLEGICNQRIYMKDFTQFGGILNGLIQQYLDQLRPAIARRDPNDAGDYTETFWMYLLQTNIELLVKQWYKVHIYKSYSYGANEGRMTVELRSACLDYRIAGTSGCFSTEDMIRLERAKIARKFIHNCRKDVCTGKTVAYQLKAAERSVWSQAYDYRELIKTNDWSKGPEIQKYSLLPIPFGSESEVYRSISKRMQDNMFRDGTSDDFQRLIEDQEAAETEEKRTLKDVNKSRLIAFFSELQRQGFGHQQNLDAHLEELANWKRSVKPDPPTSLFSEPPEFEEGTQFSYQIFQPGELGNVQDVLSRLYIG